MTLSRSDRAVTEQLSGAIERLTSAMDALAEVIRERNKQIDGASREEMRIMRKVSALVGPPKPKRQSARSRKP